MLHFARLEEEVIRMKIKSQKDFGSGLFFLLWAITHYQMGTAVRMGPAYFPAVLGGLLGVLGALILAESVMMEPEGESKLVIPFNIIDILIAVAIFVVLGFAAHWIGFSTDWAIVIGTLIVSVLTIMYRPDAK